MKHKSLLEHRNAMKKKKPEFLRQCVGEKKKLGRKWRLPRGLHSKIRRKFRGHRVRVLVGFKSPSEVRGLTRNGLKPILVINKSQLNGLDKSCGIIIGSGVGKKNKLEIINDANKKGLVVLNYKDVNEVVKKLHNELKERKSYRETLLRSRKEKKDIKKETKKEELAKESKKENVGEDYQTNPHDHTHDVEKKERDKIITQKD